MNLGGAGESLQARVTLHVDEAALGAAAAQFSGKAFSPARLPAETALFSLSIPQSLLQRNTGKLD